MKATIASLVQNVAQTVADRLQQPHQLDLTYITSRIMAMSECATAPIPTYNDDGRNELVFPLPATAQQQQTPLKKGNSSANLSTFLQKRRYDGHALILSVSDTPPDDRSLLLLRRQILHIPWASPGKERSETPSLPQLLEICYMIHAHLQLSKDNVIIVACSNGKTRSAIVVACYLYFSGQVASPLDGFSLFLSKRCPQLSTETVQQHIPPSLQQFFSNFHNVQSLGDFSNPKPLLLRAVALQGVPVDDKPCIDIWDSKQRHVYSSDKTDDSQWAEEEGFYRVNCVLEGDFCLLCRFGGAYADGAAYDPSKVLFRYANSAGFLSSGTWELPKQKVDMMRRYEASFEEEDFLVTLILESYWDVAPQQTVPTILQQNSKMLPPILQGYAALEQGWHLLTKHHACQPSDSEDVASLKSIFTELRHCPVHICTVALQLTNLDLQGTRNLLMDSPMKEWWNISSDNEAMEVDDPYDNDAVLEDWPTTADNGDNSNIRPVTPELTCQDVLDILDETDTPEAPARAALHINFDHQFHHQQYYDPNDDSIRYEPILFPNRGDIVDAFGDYSKDLSTKQTDMTDDTTLKRFPPVEPLRPRMPLHKRKRQRNSAPGNKKRRHGESGENNTQEEKEAALKLLEQINHTGVTLKDLLALQRNARHWMHPEDEEDEEELAAAAAASRAKATVGVLQRRRKRRSKSYDEEEVGEDDEDVEGFEVAGENDGPDGENDRVLGFVTKGGEDEKEKDEEEKKSEDDPPLKDDPEYSKYFKMIKMGLPNDVVKHALKRDGKDPTILDLDHNKSIKSQRVPPKEEGDDEPAIKDSEDYNKYFKMLKMGLPMGAVKNAIQRDGKDPTVMDLDPNKSLKSQRKEKGAVDNGPPLKEHPDYEKYFKMLKMGLPMGAVKNAIQRDGKDPTVMDLDPNKSLESQQKSEEDVDDGPPLKEDPDYEKYFKMLKMGLPMGAVKNAVQRDGKDPTMMDLDPNKSIKSQTGGGGDDGEDAVDPGPPVKNDPDYEKYFKMLKMGLPLGAVKNAIQRDGKDPTVMDLDPEKSIAFQRNGGGGAPEEELVDNGPPLKDDPDYSKYFKMLKMGLPLGAVKNAVQRDGKDSSIMDLDQDKSIAYQLAKKKKAAGGGGGGARAGGAVRKKAKKRVRRKKIYWTPIDPEKVVEGSLWSMVKGVVDMQKLSYDQTEFESLFTESTNPADKKKKEAKPGAASQSKKKGNAQVIDGKRSMNGGIILARLKLSYATIADMVNVMDPGTFDSTQLKALQDFLPNDEELGQLKGYLPPAGTSEADLAVAMNALPECEKYMIAMFDVKNAPAKFDAMLFKVGFQNLLDELVQGIDTLTAACNEVKNSERLRNMMAMILTLVNQINTGGDGNLALGFNLEALLKLGEAKAFDKKTSVLHYLVKLIRQNDESLLHFKDDLKTLDQAVGVILDGLVGDMKVLNEQLKKVDATAAAEADALEKEGKLPDMTAISSKDDEEDGEKEGEDTKPEAEKEEIEKDKMEVDQEDEEKESGGSSGDGSLEEDDQEKATSEVNPEAKTEESESDENKKPRTPMEVFTITAKKDVEKALTRLDDLKESYKGVLQYFGEDEKMASNEFFGTLQKFIVEFLKAADQVEKEERKKLKEKLKKAAKKAANMKLIGDIAKGGAKGDEAAQSDAPDAGTAEAPAKGKPDLGSLAAAAASAASKKNKTKQDKPDLGGIGAMAAAAAQRKGKMKESSKGETGTSGGNDAPDGPPNMSGIAAAAAAAAAKKTKKQDKPDIGGIAAMAAAAAAKRNSAINPADDGNESPAGPQNVGGIAALAAAAAAKKNKKKKDTLDVGGVAAMAAAAAASKRNLVAESTDDGGDEALAAPPNVGGIAAMAAAAAAKKNKKKQAAPGVDEAPAGPPNMSGIAAMAAAAAAKRSQNQQTKNQEEKPDIGGIAAMAAAAATKRKPRTLPDRPSGGVIAAMAVAAAGARNRHSFKQPVPKSSAIAAMAGEAAAKRNREIEESSDSELRTVEEMNPGSPSGGGIAAMAAAAAAKRNRARQESPDIDSDNTEEMNTELPSGGGIAAMAAAAAAKRNRVKQKSPTIDSDNTEEMDTELPSGGGIAAMAATAAAKRNRARQEFPASYSQELDTELPSGGGIAAMAAASAAKRNRARQEHLTIDSDNTEEMDTELPSGGGIAAMAATAAAKRNHAKQEHLTVDSDNTEEIGAELPGGGGIAAMTASAAAAEHNREDQDAPTYGGIAAMAAMAAQQRQTRMIELSTESEKGEQVDSESSSRGGVAAMAAAAAAKRNATRQFVDLSAETKKSSSYYRDGVKVDAEYPDGGSITAMAAAAAAKHQSSKQEATTPHNTTEESADAQHYEVDSESSSEGGFDAVIVAGNISTHESEGATDTTEDAPDIGNAEQVLSEPSDDDQISDDATPSDIAEVSAGALHAKTVDEVNYEPSDSNQVTEIAAFVDAEEVADSQNADEMDSEPCIEGDIAEVAVSGHDEKSLNSGTGEETNSELSNKGNDTQALNCGMLEQQDNLQREEPPNHDFSVGRPREANAIGGNDGQTVDINVESFGKMPASLARGVDHLDAAEASGKKTELFEEKLLDGASIHDDRHMNATARDSLRINLERAPSRQIVGVLLNEALPEESEFVDPNSNSGILDMVQDTLIAADTAATTDPEGEDIVRDEVTTGEIPDHIMAQNTPASDSFNGVSAIGSNEEAELSNLTHQGGDLYEASDRTMVGRNVGSTAIDLEDEEVPANIVGLVNTTEEYFAGIESEASPVLAHGGDSSSENEVDLIDASGQAIDEGRTTAKKRSSFDDTLGDDDSSSAGESTSSKKHKSSPTNDLEVGSLPLNPDTSFPMDLYDESTNSAVAPHDANMEFDILEKGNTEEDDVFLDSVQDDISGFLNDIAMVAEAPSNDEAKPKESFATTESRVVSIESGDDVSVSTNKMKKDKKHKKEKKKKKKARKSISRQAASFDEIGQMASASSSLAVSGNNLSLSTSEVSETKSLTKSKLPLVRDEDVGRKGQLFDIASLQEEEAPPRPSLNRVPSPERSSLIATLASERSPLRRVRDRSLSPRRGSMSENLASERSPVRKVNSTAPSPRRSSMSADLASLGAEKLLSVPGRKETSNRRKKSKSPRRSEKHSGSARSQLSSLKSEALSRTNSNDTFESFFDTLDDEVTAASGDGTASVDKPIDSSKRPEQQQQLDEFFSQSDGADTPKKDNSKMAQRDSTTHPTQESSTESDDEEKNEKEKEDDDKNDSGNPFQRWMNSLGGSSKGNGLTADNGDKKSVPSPAKASEQGKEDQDSSGHGTESPNGFQRFFRGISGHDLSASSLPMESPAKKSTSEPSSQHSNPFSSFVKGLTMSPLDSKMKAMQAIENENVDDMAMPTLSHDNETEPKTEAEIEADALYNSMNLAGGNVLFR